MERISRSWNRLVFTIDYGYTSARRRRFPPLAHELSAAHRSEGSAGGVPPIAHEATGEGIASPSPRCSRSLMGEDKPDSASARCAPSSAGRPGSSRKQSGEWGVRLLSIHGSRPRRLSGDPDEEAVAARPTRESRGSPDCQGLRDGPASAFEEFFEEDDAAETWGELAAIYSMGQ